jgi:hypothetical protein
VCRCKGLARVDAWMDHDPGAEEDRCQAGYSEAQGAATLGLGDPADENRGGCVTLGYGDRSWGRWTYRGGVDIVWRRSSNAENRDMVKRRLC